MLGGPGRPRRPRRRRSISSAGGRCCPSGPYLLAALLRCPVYLTFGLFHEPNRYDLYCEPFADRIDLPRGAREESGARLRAALRRRAWSTSAAWPRTTGSTSTTTGRVKLDESPPCRQSPVGRCVRSPAGQPRRRRRDRRRAGAARGARPRPGLPRQLEASRAEPGAPACAPGAPSTASPPAWASRARPRSRPSWPSGMAVNLLRFHGCGTGALRCRRRNRRRWWPSVWRRWRAGYSGVRPVVLERLVALLNHRILPRIPVRGIGGRQRRSDAAVVRGGGADRRARGLVPRHGRAGRRGAGGGRPAAAARCGPRKAWR